MIFLRAFAKINLYLRVGRKRPDGYHDILTVFQSISLADRLRLKIGPRPAEKIAGLKIHMSDPRLPADERNTIYRAYRFLCGWAPAARKVAFDVRVEKRIPVGTGLGGGSADAAGFLAGACRLLNLRPPSTRKEMRDIAREVGADVPFCMLGGAAIGRGRGEILRRIPPLPPRRIFLAIPASRVSTRDAYSRLARSRASKNLTNPLSLRSLKEVVGALRKGQTIESMLNDFQPPACRANRELAKVAEGLSRLGVSAMTGSGSAFFVIPVGPLHPREVRAAAGRAPVLEARFIGRGVEFLQGGMNGSGSHRGEDQKNRPRI